MSSNDIPEKDRNYAQLTVAALRSLTLGPDGLPSDPVQGLEGHLAYKYANGLRARLAREQTSTAKALCAVCTVFLDMVNAHRDGKRHSDWGARWVAALAGIPDVLPPEPVAVSHVSEFTELPIDSPEVQAMVAADPDLARFIGMAARGIESR